MRTVRRTGFLSRRGTLRSVSLFLLFVICLSAAFVYASHDAAAYELFAVGDGGTCFQNDGTEWRRISGVLKTGTHRFWAFSENNIYAVAGAVVFHYDGTSWDKFYTAPEGVGLAAIWCASETDIFAGGVDWMEGVLLHYDGVEWTETRYPESLHFRGVSGSSASDVYAITQHEFLHFDGIGWSEVDLGAWGDEDLCWSGLWCSASDDVYLAGYYKYNYNTCIILHYDGFGWSEIFTQDNIVLTSLWVSDDGALYASGHTPYHPVQGLVVRNSGGWQVDSIPEALRLYSVHGLSSTDVYVVGEAPTYPDSGIVCHFDGNGWDVIPDLLDKIVLSVHAVTENYVLASGSGGYMYRESGGDWTRWLPETTVDFEDVWGTSTDNLYAVCADGLIHRYDGMSWCEITGPGYPMKKIWGLSASEIYTVGEDGAFLYNGISWSQIFAEPANDIWGRSGWNLYVTNAFPTPYVKHYNGLAWTSVVSHFSYNYPPEFSTDDHHFGVWGTMDDELFVVGYVNVCDNPAMTCYEVPSTHHRDESGWEHFLGGCYNCNFRQHDVWGSSSDYVFSVGSQDTRLFDGETQTVIGEGGESVWSSGIEAWWVHSDYYDGYVIHFDGIDASNVYLNGCPLHGIWGIGEPSSTVNVTVRTDPEGPEFMIDGTVFNDPHTVASEPGETYEIGVESPQIGDEEYYFIEWSDGGDTVHTIVTPDTNVTYVVYFNRTVDVTVTTEPEGLDVIVAGDIYESPYIFSILSGTEVEIGALSPQQDKGADYYFLEWSDGGDTTHAVTLPDTNIVLTAYFSDVITDAEMDPVPRIDALYQNHPNPFNPSTTIRFSLKDRGIVSLAIYDVAGRLVRVLVDDVIESGPHELTWDGKDNAGRGVASGVYFYRLRAGEFTDTRKMVLLR